MNSIHQVPSTPILLRCLVMFACSDNSRSAGKYGKLIKKHIQTVLAEFSSFFRWVGKLFDLSNSKMTSNSKTSAVRLELVLLLFVLFLCFFLITTVFEFTYAQLDHFYKIDGVRINLCTVQLFL